MKVWITKYALTRGVFVAAADPGYDKRNIWVLLDDGKVVTYHGGEGEDWHRTRESALTRVEKMKKNKLASLAAQFEKLSKKTIEVPE